MKSALHRFVICCVLVISPFAANAEDRLSRAQLEGRAAEIDALVLSKKFEQVERVINELASPKATPTRINDSPLFTVVGALFEPSAARYQGAMEAWVAERPKSVIAAALYAHWLNSWAWEARGIRYSKDVPGEASRLYSERLMLGIKELARALSIDSESLLVGYLRLKTAREVGVPLDEQRKFFDKLNTLRPHSWAIHSQYLTGLAPKWGGESEQLLFSEARRLAVSAPPESPLVAAPIIAQDLVCGDHGGKKEYLSESAVWSEREKAYKALLARFPGAGYFAATYASDAFLVERKELGIAMLREAIAREDDNPEVVKIRKRYGHLLDDPTSLGGTPDVSRADVTTVLKQADKVYREKNYPEAEKLYRKAAEMNPTRANSWHMLGVVVAQQGRYKDAIASLVRATELNRKRASYYTQLCHARMMAGELEQGIEDCTQAIAIDSREKYAYLNRGRAYQMLGRTKEAESDFRVGNSLK